MGIESDTLYGTLNLLVLQALRDGPLHGLAVSRRIAGATVGREAAFLRVRSTSRAGAW